MRTKNEAQNDYARRLIKIREAFEGLVYKTVYEYEFNVKLNSKEAQLLNNFWNFKTNDEVFLNRFEWLAENMNRIPEIAKEKAA